MPAGVHATEAMPSSTMPLQSSSTPLHVSEVTPAPKVQVVKPPPPAHWPLGTATGGLQVMVPAQYAGVAGGFGNRPQVSETLRPLSVKPSQSLSQPSQTSAEGVTAQVPQTPPLSATPSQSSSWPLQVSA